MDPDPVRSRNLSTIVTALAVAPWIIRPRTVSEHTPIEEALGLMRSLGVRRLPVVGPTDQLVGIVGIDDFLSLLVGEFRDMGGLLKTPAPHGGLPLAR